MTNIERLLETERKRSVFEKLEEFFSTFYKDDITEVLEKYPDDRYLTVNYENLEMFDPDLADLLIEKPNEFISASQHAMRGIKRRGGLLNIKFENFNNYIPLLSLSSRHIGKFVSVEGRVKSVNKTIPIIHKGKFECRGCLRIVEVEQEPMKNIREPSLCPECGSKSFKLMDDESSYIGFQRCVLTNLKNELSERDDPVNLTVILIDDLVKKLRVNDAVRLTGIYKTYRETKDVFNTYLLVNHIEYIPGKDSDVFEEIESESSVSRNSLEYTNWRNQVFKRDKVCQCCGLDKRLHAHHIFGYEEHPELAYEVNNGIILCQFCHDKYHSVYGLKDINPVKLAKFIRRFSSNGGPLDGN